MLYFYLLMKYFFIAHRWRLVGSAIYLSELGHVVRQLASGMNSSSRGQFHVMKRLIGYLKKTLGQLEPFEVPQPWQGHSLQLWLRMDLGVISRTQIGQETERP